MSASGNIAASIRQRLHNRARSERRPFNELLQYYAMERFLYRLSRSIHADRFILKGALMLRVWRSLEVRPTMDIDMLGKTSNQEKAIVRQFRDILAVGVKADGIVFNPSSIQTERTIENVDYEGIRVRFLGDLDSARIHMQMDIGFGDEVYPEPQKCELPTILDFPAPWVLGYSRESAIAEKLETMVKLGALNSRMKDFYDVWLLCRQFDFNGTELAEAIRRTFERRNTKLPVQIDAFADVFIEAKQSQWSVFRKRLKQESIPGSFREIIVLVDRFLSPVIAAVVLGAPDPRIWKPSGQWFS